MSRIALALLGVACLASHALAKDSPEDPVAAWKKAYDTKDEAARLAAIAAIANIQSKVVVEALVQPLTKDPSIAVRKAAAHAIGGQWSPLAPLALAKAMKPDDENQKDVTIAIIAALARTESDAAVPALTALLKTRPHAYGGNGAARAADAPLSFTAQALAALQHIGSSKAIDDIIDFMGPESASTTRYRGKTQPDPLLKETHTALAAITGERHATTREWIAWWDENKSTIKTFAVFRCESTGRTFDRITATTKCPQDGEEHPHCGTFLKTRCADAKPAPEKKAK